MKFLDFLVANFNLKVLNYLIDYNLQIDLLFYICEEQYEAYNQTFIKGLKFVFEFVSFY
jgi:hypothetical protein